jgi:hypothetical protein
MEEGKRSYRSALMKPYALVVSDPLSVVNCNGIPVNGLSSAMEKKDDINYMFTARSFCLTQEQYPM